MSTPEPTTSELLEFLRERARVADDADYFWDAERLYKAAAALEAEVKARREADAALREAEKALLVNVTTWITLEPHLDREPYPDDPRWTPWTRFGKRALHRSGAALTTARDALERR